MEPGVERNRYQLILNGELMPGHTLEEAVGTLAEVFTAPAEQLRTLFDGSIHRVAQPLSADQALDLQGRLQSGGVRAHIERMAAREVLLELRQPVGVATAVEPAVVRASEPVRPAPRATEPPSAPPPPPPRSGHAAQRWRDAWADSHVEDEPDESERLAAFVGPSGPVYVQRFARVRENDRPTLRASWNWGAVLSPFLWALYRKLWGWALVIGLTEVVLPLLLLIFAHHGVLPPRFATLAYLSVIANRVFWPAVADYLYFRHVHFSLLRLFRLSPNFASDLDVANAGGVSRGAVLVGVAFSGVFGLFMWSLVSSLHPADRDPFEARVSELARHQDLTTVQTPGQVVDDAALKEREENRWTTTRRKLRELGQVVSAWMARQAGGSDPAQLTIYRLREDMGVTREALTDGWGNEIHYLPDTEGYRLISAGPDQLFGTADDISYRRVLGQ